MLGTASIKVPDSWSSGRRVKREGMKEESKKQGGRYKQEKSQSLDSDVLLKDL